MRHKIWAILVNIKYKSYLLDLLIGAFQKRDRIINVFLAISSSGSIAAWAIWQEYKFIWGVIIAISQVVTVIKPFFPYYKYVKELNGKCIKVENLNIELERLWDKFQRGKLDEDQAADTYYKLQMESNECLNFSDEIMFKVTKDMKMVANERMKFFLKSNYNVG